MWAIEWHRENDWETLFEREKAAKNDPDSDATFLENLSHDGPHRSRSKVISASQ